MKENPKHPEYYEAILQLRPSTIELVDFIKDQLMRRDDVKISKVVEHKNGLDIYLTNQKYARSTLGPTLKRRFNGELVISKSLYGRHRTTNKLIYRATVLFRLNEDKTNE